MPPKKKTDSKPLYKPMKSTRAGKKGMVYVMKNGAKRLIHFESQTKILLSPKWWN